jgi:hypothetical protein
VILDDARMVNLPVAMGVNVFSLVEPEYLRPITSKSLDAQLVFG